MLFNILLFNIGTGPFEGMPGGQLAEYIKSSIESCGHAATISFSEFRAGAVNLLFERFVSAEFCDEILSFKKSNNLAIGMIATELVVDGKIPYAQSGFNTSPENISVRLRNADYMARNLDFVWCILERTQEYYKSMATICHHFPIGSIDRFIAKTSQTPKDIDVIFFGKSTKFRHKIIEQCKGGEKVVRAFGDGFETGYLDFIFVKSLLDRAKIGLCLGFDEYDENSADVDMRIASRTRFPQMLYQGICVVSENIPLDNPYAPFIISSQPNDIASKVGELLDSGAWQQTAKILCEKFYREMDVARICASPIEKTIEDLKLHDRIGAR